MRASGGRSGSRTSSGGTAFLDNLELPIGVDFDGTKAVTKVGSVDVKNTVNDSSGKGNRTGDSVAIGHITTWDNVNYVLDLVAVVVVVSIVVIVVRVVIVGTRTTAWGAKETKERLAAAERFQETRIGNRTSFGARHGNCGIRSSENDSSCRELHCLDLRWWPVIQQINM